MASTHVAHVFLWFSLAWLAAVSQHASAQEDTQTDPSATEQTDHIIVSEAETFSVEVVSEGAEVPWALAFLPDGTALLGEREAGRLSFLNVETGERRIIDGLPDMLRNGSVSSGLFDVRVHPQYTENGWIYIAYGVGEETKNGLAVDRIRIEDERVSARENLFNSTPRISGKWHFGGRLVLSGGYLFISTGDGYDHSVLSQSLEAHAGKILRLHDDGRVPDDNPFVGTEGALPEIWSYGVRNPQGMTVHPDTGEPWLNEHGPQGGDEVNIARAGENYGWPVITYGEEYGGGPIGDGITHHEGMTQPRYYWVPSIAPSGAAFYTGTAFPGWRGNLFSGSLAFTHINRLVVEDNRILHEERLLADRGWRVRFVEPAPDGSLYFGVDDGMIMRLVPTN